MPTRAYTNLDTPILLKPGRKDSWLADSMAWRSAEPFSQSRCSPVCPDASKVALVSLVRQLQAWEFRLMDCQQSSPTCMALGAEAIPADEFLDHLTRALRSLNVTSDGNCSVLSILHLLLGHSRDPAK